LRLHRILFDSIHRHGVACLLAGLAAIVSPALASERAMETDTPETGTPVIVVNDTLYTLPPIVVRATRVPWGDYEVFMRSGFVAVLDLEGRKDRVEDLSSVLSQTVGVRVRQYGGLGSYATVSIRGSSSNQVDLYLDGMPLNDAYTGVSNLGDLSLDGFETIEIYKGFSPPHLGSSSIGGVINLVTDIDRSRGGETSSFHAEARASRGSFDTSRYILSLWKSTSSVRAFLHGSYLDTKGDFVFLDNKGTPENLADDEETIRTNNDSETIDLLGRVEVDVPFEGKLSLGHNTILRENGVPGIGSNQSAKARAERTKQITYLKLDRAAFFSKRLDAFAGAYYSTSNEKFHDPDGEISLAAQDTDNGFKTWGGNVRSVLNLQPLTLEVFWEGKDEGFRPRSDLPTPTEGPDRTRTSFVTAASGALFIHRVKLVLTGTERLQWYTSEFYDPPRFPWLPPQPQGKVTGENSAPQVGFRWLPTSFLTIKGNWGKHYRLPSFLELFGNTGSVTGSSDLEPEDGVNRDIGAVLSFDRAGRWRNLFLEVVYLDNTVENLILFFPNSQYTSRPQNIGSARIKGIEISASSLFSSWLRLSGNYSYLDGIDTGPIPYYNRNDLPGRPRHELAFSFDVIHRVGKLSYEYQRIGANYLDPANQMKVPARDIHNVALRWSPFGAQTALTLEGRNLTDNRISDVSGFPLPGRSLFATLSYER